MSWYNKETATPFDLQAIDGLHFLDGDVLAVALHQHWTEGQKMPLIQFPSGLECQLWESSTHGKGIVHLFGELDLPYEQSRDDAFQQAREIASYIGYVVKKVDDNKLELHGFEPDEHLRIIYDLQANHMLDICRITSTPEKAVHPGHVLMNDEIASKLPALYSNEEIGLDAIAPVKYFHVLSGWTWYASEYDPKTGLFFGLVNGLETELGYFSLEELQSIGRDGHSLPVERDLYYEGKSLKDLLAWHRRQG